MRGAIFHLQSDTVRQRGHIGQTRIEPYVDAGWHRHNHGWEAYRRTHNRHSPPNAMLNHLWQRIPAFQGETRPKPITKYDPNVTHPVAICRGPIIVSIDLGLVDEFKEISAYSRKPIKITMTGPHFLTTVSYDEHYNDPRQMIFDAAKLLQRNFIWLAESGL